MTLYLGSHMSVSKGLLHAAKETHKMGCNAFQIFAKSPQSTRYKCKFKDEEIEKVNEFLDEHTIEIVCHSSYMLNFAKPPSEIQWAIDSLVEDMKIMEKLDGIGCVIHMGKQCKMPSEDECLENKIKGLTAALDASPEKVKLILETAAGQGSELCVSIEKLGKLYHMFPEEYKKRIGFCVDTCHIFAAGYDCRTEDTVNEFLELWDKEIGTEHIVLIHMNDSKDVCGAKKDRHESISAGQIGNRDLSGFKRWISFAKENEIPVILETPGTIDKKDEVEMIKSWNV